QRVLEHGPPQVEPGDQPGNARGGPRAEVVLEHRRQVIEPDAPLRERLAVMIFRQVRLAPENLRAVLDGLLERQGLQRGQGGGVGEGRGEGPGGGGGVGGVVARVREHPEGVSGACGVLPRRASRRAFGAGTSDPARGFWASACSWRSSWSASVRCARKYSRR